MSGTYQTWPPTPVSGGGGGGVTTVGSMDSQPASAFGGVISGTTLYFQSASSASPGLVNNTAQGFSGAKTFYNDLSVVSTSLPQVLIQNPNAAASLIQYQNANFSMYAGLANTGSTWSVGSSSSLLASTLNVTQSGLVGIGTQSPNAQLTIIGSASPTLSLQTPNAGITVMQFQNSNGSVYAGINSVGSSTFSISSSSSLAGAPFTISAAGFVGIGIATPATPLMVNNDSGVASGEHTIATFTRGTGLSSGVTIGYRGSTSGSAEVAGFVRSIASLPFVLGTAGVQQMFTLNNSGNIFVNGNGTFGIGSTSPSYSLYVYGSAALVQSSGTSGGQILMSTGSAGANYVGFQAPSAPAPTSNIAWVLPNSDGAVNQVMKTNGSAVLGWTGLNGLAGSVSLTNQVTGVLPAANSSGLNLLSGSISFSQIAQSGPFTIGSVTQTSSTGGNNYTVRWPGTQSSGTGYLANDGNGNLSWRAGTTSAYTAPTIQKFTTIGGGTYTTPTSPAPLYIRIVMVGGGGGGAGGGDNSSAGTSGVSGSASSFGTTLLSAGGGSFGNVNGNGGAGGTSSLGSGPIGIALSGATGGAGTNDTAVTDKNIIGGSGGNTAFGGGGAGDNTEASFGSVGVANTGGGGGGGAGSTAGSSNFGGGGGGAAGYVDAIITSPSSTYAYIVGTGGGGGSGGGGASGGYAGGSGMIVVYEYYQ